MKTLAAPPTNHLACGCIVHVKPSEVSVHPCCQTCPDFLHIMYGALESNGTAEGGPDQS